MELFAGEDVKLVILVALIAPELSVAGRVRLGKLDELEPDLLSANKDSDEDDECGEADRGRDGEFAEHSDEIDEDEHDDDVMLDVAVVEGC